MDAACEAHLIESKERVGLSRPEYAPERLFGDSLRPPLRQQYRLTLNPSPESWRALSFFFPSCFFFHFLSCSFIFFHVLSFSFIFFYFLAFSCIFFHFLSFSCIFFHFLSFSFIFFVFFLSFSFSLSGAQNLIFFFFLTFVTISRLSSYVKNHFWAVSRGTPLGPLFFFPPLVFFSFSFIVLHFLSFSCIFFHFSFSFIFFVFFLSFSFSLSGAQNLIFFASISSRFPD